ncbi:unnamed protein product [Amoebophrya sp. A120]|nr:unnamed protein product [Amoebophrya sp. A120]|eukprot:GSA120T00004463001.1
MLLRRLRRSGTVLRFLFANSFFNVGWTVKSIAGHGKVQDNRDLVGKVQAQEQQAGTGRHQSIIDKKLSEETDNWRCGSNNSQQSCDGAIAAAEAGEYEAAMSGQKCQSAKESNTVPESRLCRGGSCFPFFAAALRDWRSGTERQVRMDKTQSSDGSMRGHTTAEKNQTGRKAAGSQTSPDARSGRSTQAPSGGREDLPREQLAPASQEAIAAPALPVGDQADEDLLRKIMGAEAGLMFSGERKLLNENQGVLSFLSAQDVGKLLQSTKAGFGGKVAAAAHAQHHNDTSLESRTESCEDLFLEVLRERVGAKRPEDYWNRQIDMGVDYLEHFLLQMDRDQNDRTLHPPQTATSPGGKQKQDWTVYLLMTMATETCGPAVPHRRADTTNKWLLYSSKALAKGCHRNDRTFFREVLDFFHEDVPVHRRSVMTRLLKRETQSKAVVWNPPRTNAFARQRAAGGPPVQLVDMSLNPNQKTLDGRCRLAMATEFLFQKPSRVYERLFPVRLGYCLNKSAELSDDNGARPFAHFFHDDPLRLDAQYYPAFRKMFRKLAGRWRSQSDGSDLGWSYDQLQWDWRSFHGKRLKHTFEYTGKYPIRPVPKMLDNRPADFLVKFPTKILDAL